MPTLLLSARQTEDAQLLWRASIAVKWDVVRVHGWQVPSLPASDVAIYGEPLFAQHVAQTLGLRPVEPPHDWLPRLPACWRGRDVRLTTLAEARKVTERAFIKPADEKCFDARVYSSGAELPGPGPLPDDLPVLMQEVVECESALCDPNVSVPDAVVLDVGVIRNHGWAVIECNAAFSAGIYGCDPTAVLPVLRRACVPIATNANDIITLFRPV